MKKIITTIMIMLSFACMAHHHHGFHHHGHFHHNGWVASVVGGIITGAVIGNYMQTRTWIPGYYQTVYYPNGIPYQIWVPGHWEYR